MGSGILSLWNLFQLALVSVFSLFAVLVSVVYRLNRVTIQGQNEFGANVSPLQDLLIKGNNMEEDLHMTDCGMLRKMNELSTMELKTLIIAETVVPFQDMEKLAGYIQRQLDASEVITEQQKRAVMIMVHLVPMKASINKEEIGESGTLRNSAVIALFKRHLDNIHFMLIGVRAEPKLGMKRISSAERNSWNDVLSRVLYNKVRVEAKKLLLVGAPNNLLYKT